MGRRGRKRANEGRGRKKKEKKKKKKKRTKQNSTKSANSPCVFSVYRILSLSHAIPPQSAADHSQPSAAALLLASIRNGPPLPPSLSLSYPLCSTCQSPLARVAATLRSPLLVANFVVVGIE
ncbi:unnamed protein product [Citrullus colocynthis]|uniref:Uncharacterized protein n=1 Tax=Citrullus colocynthis TaxID=252529 RepID=A0ABP0Z242_9ROSI